MAQVTEMSWMFYNATAFNRSLATVNITGLVLKNENWGTVGCMKNMLLGSGMNQSNMDASVVGWASQVDASGVTLTTTSGYSPSGAAVAAVATLRNTWGWTVDTSGVAGDNSGVNVPGNQDGTNTSSFFTSFQAANLYNPPYIYVDASGVPDPSPVPAPGFPVPHGNYKYPTVDTSGWTIPPGWTEPRKVIGTIGQVFLGEYDADGVMIRDTATSDIYNSLVNQCGIRLEDCPEFIIRYIDGAKAEPFMSYPAWAQDEANMGGTGISAGCPTNKLTIISYFPNSCVYQEGMTVNQQYADAAYYALNIPVIANGKRYPLPDLISDLWQDLSVINCPPDVRDYLASTYDAAARAGRNVFYSPGANGVGTGQLANFPHCLPSVTSMGCVAAISNNNTYDAGCIESVASGQGQGQAPYAMPPWQEIIYNNPEYPVDYTQIPPPVDGVNLRLFPDVATNTGYSANNPYSWMTNLYKGVQDITIYYGSATSMIMSGIMAAANIKVFLPPYLYYIYGDTSGVIANAISAETPGVYSYEECFHNITFGNSYAQAGNGYVNPDPSGWVYPSQCVAQDGYDLVKGLGSLNVQKLASTIKFLVDGEYVDTSFPDSVYIPPAYLSAPAAPPASFVAAKAKAKGAFVKYARFSKDDHEDEE